MSTDAVSINGAWDLVVKAPGGPQMSVVTLKADNGVLTGTISNDEFGEQAIEDGRFDGELLTWKVKWKSTKASLSQTVSYVATLDEDRNLRGHIKAAMAKILFFGSPVE